MLRLSTRHYMPLLLLLLQVCSPQKTFAQRRIIDSILTVLKQPVPDSGLPYLYYRLAKEYLHISTDSSGMYAQRSMPYARKYNKPIYLAEDYGILGVIEKNKGNYAKALDYHLKGKDIKEKFHDEKGLLSSYNDIGIVYKKMKRWDEALMYYKKSNALAQKLNNARALANTYNNIGTIYEEKAMWDSVTVNLDRGLAVAEKLQEPDLLATLLTNIGDCYMNTRRVPEALQIFKRCLGYDKQNEDFYGMTASYFHIAEALDILGKADEAALYMDSADRIAIKENLRRERVDITYRWAVLEEKRHNYPHALELQRLSMAIKDSILNEDTQQQLSELQTKYETSKKEQKIALQQADITRKNYIIGGVSGLMALGLLLGLSSYRRYRLKQQSVLQKEIIRQQELATKAVIDAEEKERKRIAGDLHDGVGQLMSAARLNLSVIGNELPFTDEQQKQSFDKVMALVDEGCKEVRTVSHNIMPNALLKAGLASAIREFIDKIDHRVLQVNLFTEGINDRMEGNTESVLYRVIQECVNNVIKHSGANQLDISLIKDEDGISVTIEDNGQGFNTRDRSKYDGIGLQNIRTRVEYLKGTVEWDSSPGKGTVVTIQVPKP
ncbi:MAG: sensor histidine kinase [Bacteroidetes bacterium]|nr:sensor histidine kinase [Bacteroidota bacterium]